MSHSQATTAPKLNKLGNWERSNGGKEGTVSLTQKASIKPDRMPDATPDADGFDVIAQTTTRGNSIRLLTVREEDEQVSKILWN